MESPNKYCNVKNRSASVVVYSIADSGIRRSFAPGEVKKVSYEELEKLELLVTETKRKRDRDFVEDLMNNVANALDKAKRELNKRYGDKFYVKLEINGNSYYLDEDITIEIVIDDIDDECESEVLYSEYL